ncbi:MAG: hypothetical protein KTR27_17245, partial [Leptolyngbyaceae cyanobacterium MAG.088]|nr:hypothetical protein [Leptolyngbyaceae cyanobacterium MAG.088]
LLLDPFNILIADTASAGFIAVEQTDGALADFLYGELEDAKQNSHLTPETVEALLALNDLTLEATNIIVVTDDVNAFSENDLTLQALAIGVIDARLGQSGGGDIFVVTPQVNDSFIFVSGGQIDTDVLSGNSLEGGNISITTYDLTVTNNGVVSASTFGEGNSGQVAIDATGDITVDGKRSSIASTIESDAVGNSSGVLITTDNLSVLNGAAVSASTFGEGNSGQVAIDATGDIIVDGERSFIASRVIRGAVGNSGGISITTDNLSVLNGAEISAGTFGEGNSGQVAIKATGDIIVDGELSLIVSPVNPNAVGNSGGISITTDNLSVLNGAVVSASTNGEGNSGQVVIEATGNIIVDGERSLIVSTVERRAVGNSGGISITTDNLSVLNGAAISASTFGKGTAGVLRLQSNPDANLTVVLSEDSSISTLTDSQEDGGNLIITSDGALTIQGPGELTTESVGTDTGAAGDLNIVAGSVLLDDGVELSTQTASIEGGGNINFQVEDGIILRQGSFINAESTNENTGSGSGGNITLNANFVLAFPDENSDIIANAVGGDGGNIQINAAGIFGLTEQGGSTTSELRANASSDISASSQSGQQGTISLNADFEQTQGLDELPDNFINADQLVASSCIARSDDSEGTFVITGGGGLPQQPGETPRINYPTSTIRASYEVESSQALQEPEGIYQLADGGLVMSHECED